MKTISKLLLLTLTVLSCSPDEILLPEINTVSVSNSADFALVAKINFTVRRKVKACIEYWPVAADTLKIKRSALAPSAFSHSIPLFQLKENTTYHYRITFPGESNGDLLRGDVHTFTTAAIPDAIKNYYPEKGNAINDTLLPGHYFVVPSGSPNALLLINEKGEIDWHWSPAGNFAIKTARITPQKTILALLAEGGATNDNGNVLLEISLAGDTLFHLRKGEKGFDKFLHHDVLKTTNGNLIAITREQSKGLIGDGIVVLDSHGNKKQTWSIFTKSDPAFLNNYYPPEANSIAVDIDANYLISFRALHQVWKVKAADSEVLWKLGEKGTFPLASNSRFLFQNAAHSNAKGEIVLLDNGSESRPISRVLSFKIDTEQGTATPVIDTSLPAELYSPEGGNAAVLPDSNLLVVSSIHNKLIKISKSGTIVWSMTTSGPMNRAEFSTGLFKTTSK